MFQWFRRGVEAVECLTSAVEKTNHMRAEGVAALERIESLELSLSTWKAECDAILLMAEGKLRAANNSEARERTMKKSYEKHADPFAEEGEKIQEAVPSGDVEGGEESEVQPLRVDVEETVKARALRLKFA